MPEEFVHKDMSGSTFRDVTLRGASFRHVDLRDMSIRGAWLMGTEISGEIENLRINGVDVAPLVDAELDRRYPDRAKMRPSDPEGFREAWDALERLWLETVERARRLDPEQLHQRVNDEWSFIETLRHLVFATDAWVTRAILGDPSPWDPLHLPHDDMEEAPSVPRDPDARPTLDEVLAVRAERMATVRSVIADLTQEKLGSMTTPVLEPGYPEPESFPVNDCLLTILHEEWEHRLYAERDLAILESRAARKEG